MKLYHNSSLLQAVFKAIGEKNEYLVKENINQFTEPNFNGIDSLRFIATKAFLNKFKSKFNLEFKEKELNTQREIFANLGANYKIGTTQFFKLTANISIYAFHSEQTIIKSRKSRTRLNNYIILSIHGLQQYDRKNGLILHTEKTRQILNYLLRYCDTQKSRNNITLKSFDIALDYFEKAEICKSYAISKAEYLENLDCEFKKYKDTSTLYIQNRDYKKPICDLLRKIRIYDKAVKNSLLKPLIRFELVFKI